ncbi:hypothetical protein M942_00265 [Enterobacter ludwigii]|jgi:hypothetical protein|nr:hypothetical protein M942_00265 [Enterobacter ludwigii]
MTAAAPKPEKKMKLLALIVALVLVAVLIRMLVDRFKY